MSHFGGIRWKPFSAGNLNFASFSGYTCTVFLSVTYFCSEDRWTSAIELCEEELKNFQSKNFVTIMFDYWVKNFVFENFDEDLYYSYKIFLQIKSNVKLRISWRFIFDKCTW